LGIGYANTSITKHFFLLITTKTMAANILNYPSTYSEIMNSAKVKKKRIFT